MAEPRLARTRTGTGIWIVIAVLLAASLVGTLWVPIVAILSAAAYLLSRLTHRGQAAAAPRPPEKDPGEVS